MLLLRLSLRLGCLCLLRCLGLVLLLLLVLERVLLSHQLLRVLLLRHSPALAQLVDLLLRELRHTHGHSSTTLCHIGVVRLLRHHLIPRLLLPLKHLVLLHSHGCVMRRSVKVLLKLVLLLL